MMDPSFCHLVEVVIAAPFLADRYSRIVFVEIIRGVHIIGTSY